VFPCDYEQDNPAMIPFVSSQGTDPSGQMRNTFTREVQIDGMGRFISFGPSCHSYLQDFAAGKSADQPYRPLRHRLSRVIALVLDAGMAAVHPMAILAGSF
jgi:hypothetical protein